MPEIDELLTQLRHRYRARLLGQLDELRELVVKGDLASVRRHLHRMHGTAGSYGLFDVADRLTEARRLLDDPGATDRRRVDELISDARRLTAEQQNSAD